MSASAAAAAGDSAARAGLPQRQQRHTHHQSLGHLVRLHGRFLVGVRCSGVAARIVFSIGGVTYRNGAFRRRRAAFGPTSGGGPARFPRQVGQHRAQAVGGLDDPADALLGRGAGDPDVDDGCAASPPPRPRRGPAARAGRTRRSTRPRRRRWRRPAARPTAGSRCQRGAEAGAHHLPGRRAAPPPPSAIGRSTTACDRPARRRRRRSPSSGRAPGRWPRRTTGGGAWRGLPLEQVLEARGAHGAASLLAAGGVRQLDAAVDPTGAAAGPVAATAMGGSCDNGLHAETRSARAPDGAGAQGGVRAQHLGAPGQLGRRGCAHQGQRGGQNVSASRSTRPSFGGLTKDA